MARAAVRQRVAAAKGWSPTEPFQSAFMPKDFKVCDNREHLYVSIMSFLSYDLYNGGFANACWGVLLTATFPCMRHLPLSRMLLGLCMRAARNRLLFTDNLLDFIEYSCGVAQITLALCMAGLVGAAFDKQHSAGQNCLLPEGLALWINAITMTKPGSLQWFGTQCSSFVPVCANNHKRCPDNYYLGDTSRAFVRDGNTQMAITSLLMMLSFWIDNVPILEQPLDSCMPQAAPLTACLTFTNAMRITTYLQVFGAPTLKPLQIWSVHTMIATLAREKPVALDAKSGLCKRHGDNMELFTGVPDDLTSSQAYPKGFGRAVGHMFAGHYPTRV